MTTAQERSTLSQLFFFGMVGGVQYLVDVGTFSLLWKLSGWVAGCNVAARLLAAVCGYTLNSRFTFRSASAPEVAHARRRRFIVAWLLMTAVSTLCITLLSEVAEEDTSTVIFFKAGLEAVMAVCGFLLCKLWVFADIRESKLSVRTPLAAPPPIPIKGPTDA